MDGAASAQRAHLKGNCAGRAAFGGLVCAGLRGGAKIRCVAMGVFSRIPTTLQRSASKREAPESIVAVAASSPLAAKTGRHLESPLTPSSFSRKLSMASGRSPSAGHSRAAGGRPPAGNRLSMYGVPLAQTLTPPQRVPPQPPRSEAKRIVVCARKRPLTRGDGGGPAKGPKGGEEPADCIAVAAATGELSVATSRMRLDGISKASETFTFAFDRVFGETATNRAVYASICRPLVDFAIGGGRATCFAYGQTGSGKTHTMFHVESGLCRLALEDMLLATEGSSLELRVSFFEIYQGQLYDLLQERKRLIPCETKSGRVSILGLSEAVVASPERGHAVILGGLQARITGKTGANAASSRSHAILQLSLCYTPPSTDGGPAPPRGGDEAECCLGRLSFIDLAGSERGADRENVDRRTRLEGSEINKSLLALKECIRAIDQDASHLPFRQSKLTLVLKDSIVGDVRTAMIATVSPASSSAEHTLNMLRYAERFREIGSGPGGRGGSPDDEAAEAFDDQQPRAAPAALSQSYPVVTSPGGALRTEPTSAPRRHAAGERGVMGAPLSPRAGPSLAGAMARPVCADAGRRQAGHVAGSPAPRQGGDRRSLPAAVVEEGKATPARGDDRVTTVTFRNPSEVLIERRNDAIRLLLRMQDQINGCSDEDVLELLGEELNTLSQAFQTLS